MIVERGLLPAGKLPHRLLAELLAALPHHDTQLLVGPGVGEDAAVIDFAPGGDRLLVAKSDPITFATDEIGYYAVNVCVNDLAVCGARSRFYFPTVLIPPDQSDARTITAIFDQIGATCRKFGIVVAGGHTEITPTVAQPIVSGALLGEVERLRLVTSAGSQAGDAVLMAGAAPIEGASIIARERRPQLRYLGWSENEITTAANYLFDPGISVMVPALAAADAGLVTAMHDPTEGGIATGLLELATASEVGLAIDLDLISIPEIAKRLCDAFGLDPLGTIASGALLATAPPENVDTLLALWAAKGWPGKVIGAVLPRSAGVSATRGGGATSFPHFEVDEITRLWA